MSPTDEESYQALTEKAAGFAEQLSSLSLPELTEKYDGGNKSPRAVVSAPGSLTTRIKDVGTKDPDLSSQFAQMVFKKTEERIKTAMNCREVEVRMEDASKPLRRGQSFKLEVQAWF